MDNRQAHTFHIPVMGLGFTIDTPIKVAHFGISSVISIVEDGLAEDMRRHYCNIFHLSYVGISDRDDDHRAKRITAYLNLVNQIVTDNTEKLRRQPFEKGGDLYKYFELLPDNAELKLLFEKMQSASDVVEKQHLQHQLREAVCAGNIDVNIMSKVDRNQYDKDGTPMATEYADALAALRGFALSNLNSSVVFSAGYNPRLYSYIESFDDFYPDAKGSCRKKIILKVSDYRSAVTQGKLLAKKGVWISEFRIESGLNCGGHAFATDGLLLGPILEEFKQNKLELARELFTLCNQSLTQKGKNNFSDIPETRVTVQGGIGTSNENKFLLDYYQTNSTGWGSPFLLVPEATNVDKETLYQLANAVPDDYYMSNASPLGIPFNNFRKTTSEKLRQSRMEKGKPGSPCNRKFLAANTEFTKVPICTASRQYQRLKIKQLQEQHLEAKEYETKLKEVTDKECLCSGLSASALLVNNIEPKDHLKAVAICPGPNLAYFSGVFSLRQMVDHIYGRINILNSVKRPNMFINELKLYVDYLKKEIDKSSESLNNSKIRHLKTFQANLLEGINYYKKLKENFVHELEGYKDEMHEELNKWERTINELLIPVTG